MPLIGGSRYDRTFAVSRGATIGRTDPHETLLHLAMSVNTESRQVEEWGGFAQVMGGPDVNPLGWIGSTLEVYADAGDLWAKLAEVESSGYDEVLEAEGFALPIALQIEVGSVAKLAAFLAGVRTLVDTVPDLTMWTPSTHNDRRYVRVALDEGAKAGDPWDEVEVFYAATPRALIITPNEDVMRRALDRIDARGGEAPEPASVWVGEQAAQHRSRGMAHVHGRVQRSAPHRHAEASVGQHPDLE